MKLVLPHLDLPAEKNERESRDARAREERREAVPAKAASPNYCFSARRTRKPLVSFYVQREF